MSKIIDIKFECDEIITTAVRDQVNCYVTNVDVDDIADDVVQSLSAEDLLEYFGDVDALLDVIGEDKVKEYFAII